MHVDVEGAVVVVAKCPIKGASKTRLSKHISVGGNSHLLSKAMLCDVIASISSCSYLSKVKKVLMYAPGTSEGEGIMSKILSDELNLPHKSTPLSTSSASSSTEETRRGEISNHWILMPMRLSASTDELRSSNLGERLSTALSSVRREVLCQRIDSSAAPQTCNRSDTNKSPSENQQQPGVVFLGMDSPEIPLEEVAEALYAAQHLSESLICPANDGGYGMIGVPAHANARAVFSGVRWSNELTALSQIKSLTDHSVSVRLGKLMNDIDEPNDLVQLAHRLCDLRNRCDVFIDNNENVTSSNMNEFPNYAEFSDSDCLSRNSKMHLARIPSQSSYAQFTWECLLELQLILKKDAVDMQHHGRYFVAETGV